MIGKIAPLVHDLLRKEQITITFVDVGSRNGVLQLADLAPFIEAYGFEPNPAEYAKLLTGSTDAYQIAGIKPPAYRKLEYSPYAIADRSGRATFYVTPGPGACGLLEPDIERLREIIWKGRRYQKNFGDDIFASYQTIDVDVRTIDAWAADKQVDYIDYLKIDVEGSEWEVLSGARSILARTGVVKVETCFIPFRKGQRLFSDVDLVLREFGFDLLRYEIEQSQIGYKKRVAPVQGLPQGYADPYGQPLSCDAVYVNRTLRDRQRIIAAAAVLIDKNYIDEALYMLETKVNLDNPALLGILREYDSGVTTGWWLRGVAYQWVDKFLTAAGRVTRLGRS